MTTRLVVADDSALLREGLGLLQRQGFEVVATESRADATRQTVTELVARGEIPLAGDAFRLRAGRRGSGARCRCRAPPDPRR